MGGKQNENLKKLVYAGIVTLALVIPAKATLVNSNSIVQDGIEYYIQTDKAVYNLGEEIQMLYRVTNVSENPVDIGMVLRGGGWCDFFVTDDDNTDIWQWMRVMPPSGWEMLHLEQDEFRERQIIWDMISDNATPFDRDDDYPVGPGSYNITGELRLDGGYERVPVSVSIEIIPEPAMIYYVDADANGANDGSSWGDAYNDLQDALTVASSGDEIRVAQGIYKPDQGIGISPGDREATFQLKNGVAIRGGYAGFGEPDPNARDIDLYETILSGDLNGDDLEIVNPQDLWGEPSRAENSYHVVTGSATGETAVLDGFTITGGNANSLYPYNCGGGIFNSSSSSKLIDCIFHANSAKRRGGGMYNEHGSPTLTNCTFSENSAKGGGGMANFWHSSPRLISCMFIGNTADWGGGMTNYWSSTMVTNCIFRGNSADYGGGMYNAIESPTVVACMFSGNSSGGYGGGMCNATSSPILTNCAFTNNSAENGGGVYNGEDKGPAGFEPSDPTLTNCTFTGNSARYGGGMFNTDESSPILTNCILWGDTSNEVTDEFGCVTLITYSDVQGGWPGEGNIDADPCFVQPGYWDANGLWVDGDYHLLPDSPCIDAGDPNYVSEPNETDLDGKPRVIGGRIDMGAYEYSPPILAEVRIVPRTLNLASEGRWITCYIWLGEDYDVVEIDPNSVVLEDEIQAESILVYEQQQIAVARFSRSEVQGILNIGEVELTISGQLMDGTVFEGADVIRVIDKGGGKSAK